MKKSLHRQIILLVLVLSLPIALIQGQYAPSVGQPGTMAVYKDSSAITGWATGCQVNRGPIEIDDPELTYGGSSFPTIGSETDATGKADNKVVSLGDGGSAVLTFDHSIMNNAGPDFAVFENGFFLAGSDTLAFLELAFVEVSTDGEHFVRFPAVSNIPTDEQFGNFSYVNATLVHNLAGKYTANYGTPFDLEDIKDSTGINVNEINYVKVIDVIGNISDTYASYDSKGNKINDPWPTPFNTCGFDLDAVGVIQSGTATDVMKISVISTRIYPNPVTHRLYFDYQQDNLAEFALYDVYGRLILNKLVNSIDGIDLERVPSGVYIIKIKTGNDTTVKRIIKQ
jgi:hypothetical protein